MFEIRRDQRAVPGNARGHFNRDSPDDPLAVKRSVAELTVVGESGPDPKVRIAISRLRRADLAIKSPAGDLFAL